MTNDLDQDEYEEVDRCAIDLFRIAKKLEAMGNVARKNNADVENAIRCYNSAVQTIVTAHQINESLMQRAAWAEAHQHHTEPRSANKGDFQFGDDGGSA